MRQDPPPSPFPPPRIWILGAGRFGRLAAKRLKDRYGQLQLLVIDHRADRLDAVQRELNLPVICEDAVQYILRHPLPDDLWIVPAVPVHVAFEWLFQNLGRGDRLPVPEAVDAQVPHPLRAPSGTVYASYADFLCPDACSEPEEICTHTKAPRLGNLFETLADIRIPECRVIVVRSHQLAPGVGGYPSSFLLQPLARIRDKPGRYLIATSCRCHGVLDCLNWEGSRSVGPPT